MAIPYDRALIPRLIGLALSGVLLSSTGCSSQPENTPSASSLLAEMVREAYSGDLAFETVAFLDQYVRWPGNHGFDASIDHLVERLEAAGYVREDGAPDGAPLTYRVEEYPMDRPAWEPLRATVTIVGEEHPLLSLTTNRNMLAINSFSTPEGGIEAELVDAGDGTATAVEGLDLLGKILLVDGSISRTFRDLVVQQGAVGMLAYSLPSYLEPEKNTQSIQFRSIPREETSRSWGILLSYEARERLRRALAEGPVRLRVETSVQWTEEAVERTVVADIRGSVRPDERFVFSAHVQETGANDNASGVGAQMEMARVASGLYASGDFIPARSITFLWGDEIRSTARYIEQDDERARGIHWGMALDMVGENTSKTGGTFLIEKMPDPSAIWTRGEESHTDWGGRPLTKDDMTPHYLNDLVLQRALEQAASNGWVVKTNPFEGGSDHVPFLNADIPALLLWHFTDQFYHTDGDRLEMVSKDELKNSGVTALVTAFTLASADRTIATALIDEIHAAALERISTETTLSREAILAGGAPDIEQDILATWTDWYDSALARMDDIEVGGSSTEILQSIERARASVREAGKRSISELGS